MFFFLCQWRCSALIKMNCKLYGLFYYLNCHSKRYPPLRPILDAHTPMFKTNSRPTVQFDIIIVENMDDFMGSSDVVFREWKHLFSSCNYLSKCVFFITASQGGAWFIIWILMAFSQICVFCLILFYCCTLYIPICTLLWCPNNIYWFQLLYFSFLIPFFF